MKVQVTLDEHEENHLNALSQHRGITTGNLSSHAIREFTNGKPNVDDEVHNWSAMSLAAFERERDNDEDAVYDNWRAPYAVQPG